MSSVVNLDMCLIASKGLLPKEKLHEVFLETLPEVNGIIKNNILYIDNQPIGSISLKDRIVVKTYSERALLAKNKTTELRNVFTRRSQVAIEDYKNELETEQRRLKESNLAYEELKKRIKENQNKIEQQEKAIVKQNMSSCEAMTLELKESAENQGYDVVENKTEEGIQLQFIRRIY